MGDKMLLTEKLLNTKFSPSEKIIVDYMLKHKYDIKNKNNKKKYLKKPLLIHPLSLEYLKS